MKSKRSNTEIRLLSRERGFIALYLILALSRLAAVSARGQVNIVSLSPNGLLTWSNLVTNATYSVQWAASAAGPWQSFANPTNLNAISGTNLTMTAQVFTADGTTTAQTAAFFRVVRTDPPPYAGVYDLTGYDMSGDLVMTGQLCLAGDRSSSQILGDGDLDQVRPVQHPAPGYQLGDGWVSGGFSDSPIPNAGVGLYMEGPGYLGPNLMYFTLRFVGNVCIGQWQWSDGEAYGPQGTFYAVRQDADPAPAAEPGGKWNWISFPAQITFTTSTNPLCGSWSFGLPGTPSGPPGPLVGQGNFTNGIISGNTITLGLVSTGGTYCVQGQMCGDYFAGSMGWLGTNQFPPGPFWATRAAPVGGTPHLAAPKQSNLKAALINAEKTIKARQARDKP
jgi:hypothetical protein